MSSGGMIPHKRPKPGEYTRDETPSDADTPLLVGERRTVTREELAAALRREWDRKAGQFFWASDPGPSIGFLDAADAIFATLDANRAASREALGDADARIRAAEPPTHSTDEFKAGWHQAVSRSLTAVARARHAAALAQPDATAEDEFLERVEARNAREGDFPWPGDDRP